MRLPNMTAEQALLSPNRNYAGFATTAGIIGNGCPIVFDCELKGGITILGCIACLCQDCFSAIKT